MIQKQMEYKTKALKMSAPRLIATAHPSRDKSRISYNATIDNLLLCV
jgi:hypothetical protein